MEKSKLPKNGHRATSLNSVYGRINMCQDFFFIQDLFDSETLKKGLEFLVQAFLSICTFSTIVLFYLIFKKYFKYILDHLNHFHPPSQKCWLLSKQSVEKN